ncbi:hypothetical protein [Clostridium botulinum]|uniref:hypothetical protein n=1 Tax=Clostridium botulinum TaxID=1491 RepID=UPI001749CEF8|nr:hypothetical protein [Clostridium botulinum]MBD5589225.1 hypothetical protein [Clostridium botulinum]
MNKKITLGEVQAFAKENSFEVLDAKYISITTKMNFKCLKCGEITIKSYDSLKQSSNCQNCKKNELNKQWDSVLNDIINICKKHNKVIPLKQLKKEGINFSVEHISNIIRKKGYKSYKDFCIQHNLSEQYIISGKKIFKNDITIQDLKILWEECEKKYNVILGAEICNKKSKEWNIPTWHSIKGILNKYNMSLNDFYNYINIGNYYHNDITKYDFYLNKFVEISNKLGRYLKSSELTKNNWGLPNSKWFLEHCTNKNVTDYNEFIEWLGFKPLRISKEKAIEIIFDMQYKLNRPLIQTDFDNPKDNEVGKSTIDTYWGNLNNMKKDLNLPIVKENMLAKRTTFDQSKQDIIKLCNYIYKTENRKIILTSDTDKLDELLDFNTYRKYFKRNNTNIRDFIEDIGFQLQKQSSGLVYNFQDGEITLSQYEFYFSNFLKNKLFLKYNKDYFRDVRYKEFATGYNGLMDCDYVINFKNRKIYIEIAGMLRNLHKYYYNNIIIKNSKHIEKYRQNLMIKEKLLKENNLEYYILFPINKNYQTSLDWNFINGIF